MILGDSVVPLSKEFRSLVSYLAGEIQFDQELASQVRSIIGFGFRPADFKKRPGLPFDVTWNKKSAWFVWEPVAGASGALRLGLFPRLTARMRIQNALGDFLATGSGPTRGLIVDRRNRSIWGSRGMPLDGIRNLWRGRKLSGEGLRVLPTPDRPEKIIFFARFEDKVTLFLERPVFPRCGWLSRECFGAAFLLVLFLATMGFQHLEEDSRSFSLKGKFYGLFAYVVILPLVGASLLALGWLGDRKQAFWRDRLQETRGDMMVFDHGFLGEPEKVLGMFRKISLDPLFQSGRLEEFGRRVDRLIAADQIAFLAAKDLGGNQLLARQEGPPDPASQRLQDLTAEVIIQNVLHGPDPGDEKRSLRLRMFEEMLETPTLGIPVNPSATENFGLMKAGGNSQFQFTRFFPGSKMRAPYVTMTCSRRQAILRFLKRNLVRNRPFRLLAFDRRAGKWLGGRHSPEMSELVAETQRTGVEQTGFARIGSEEFILLSPPPIHLEDFNLVAALPMSLWDSEIAGLRFQGLAAVLSAILVGILCTNLLSAGILKPLGAVSEGIRALRRRERGFRIPPFGNDELGRLGLAFNQMLENSDDLDLAEDVQETLLPAALTLPEGYSGAFRMKMCSRLGGDFLDQVALNDGTYGFLMGDVSGHGVGSALIAAMVKAATAVHFQKGGDWTGVFQELNGILYHLTDKRRMMGCLGLHLSACEHRLTVTTAGNPFPLIWRAKENRFVWVGRACFPLGIRRNLQLPALKTWLDEGDLLLAFSDGLVESIGADSLPFGFPRLEKIFVEWAREGPRVLVARIESAWETHREGNPQSDDLTLFALGRAPKGGWA